MSDADAVYRGTRDALARALTGFDAGHILASAISEMDIGQRVYNAVQEATSELTRPSVIMRPTLTRVKNRWVAEYGSHYPDNFFATGKTPAEAMLNFDRRWHGQPTSPTYYVGFTDPNTIRIKALDKFEQDGGLDAHKDWVGIFAEDIDDATAQAGRLKQARDMNQRVTRSLEEARGSVPFANLGMDQEPYDPGD